MCSRSTEVFNGAPEPQANAHGYFSVSLEPCSYNSTAAPGQKSAQASPGPAVKSARPPAG